MRVLLACPYDWGAPGGVQVHVRELAAALRSRGHETLVLAPGRTGASEDDVRIVGTAIRVPYGGKVAPICFSRASWRRIRRLVDVFEPDVVHAHEPFSPSTAMLTVLASTVPAVATFHAFHERSRLLAVAAPFLRAVARKLVASIAVSEAAAEFVATVVEGGIEIVPNGIDVDRWSRAEPTGALPAGRRLLWASRLDPQKGFDVAVRAFARLATEFDDLVFVVAGDGRDRDALELLPPAVRARAVMLGAVPNVELPRYHASCHVFVAPATGHESFGIVLVEALAAGLPVVATNIPGFREVIRDGVDGLLVPPGDDEAVASAIARVLSEPELAAELSTRGPERAREFSWDVVTPRIEAIYERAR